MKQRNIIISGVSIIIVLYFQSCGVFRQTRQMKNFANCDFRITTVENIVLSGINVQQLKGMNDLNMLQAGKILAGLAGGNLPISMTVNIEAKNPNNEQAIMNKMEWILYVDSIQLINGILNKNITIPPDGGKIIIPMDMSFNILDFINNSKKDDLLNTAFNLVDKGNRPIKIKIKAKPSIIVGRRNISYPGYITITRDFTGKI